MNIYLTKFLTYDDPSTIKLLITLTTFKFYFKTWQSYYLCSSILSMHKAALTLIGTDLELLFDITIVNILEAEQYVHRDPMHFLTY